MHVGFQGAAGVAALGRVVAGIQATGRQPVAKLVIMGGHGKHHAHPEPFAPIPGCFHDRPQRAGANGMFGPAVGIVGDVLAHGVPDIV